MTPQPMTDAVDPTRLIVPMTLEALVLTEDSQNDAWSCATAQYQPIAFFNKLDADPFNSLPPRYADGSPILGVMLHWALPDGLTRGAAPTDEHGKPRVDFPLVPNRWLVARTAITPTGDRSTAAWIVESDYIGDDGAVPFPDVSSSEFGAWNNIGRHVPLETWEGDPPAGTRQLFLKAVGAGNPTFAAFVPNVRDVFAFVDDVSALENVTLNYLVAGWYSNPQDDPLAACANPTQWHDFLDQRGWSVTDTPIFATQTLPCGMLYHVRWEGKNKPPQSGVPDELPRVAVGNTAIEALAALIEAELPEDDARSREAALLLEAFQYNLLSTIDKAGGQLDLDLRLHAASFGGSPGGTFFRLVPKEDDSNATPADAVNLPAKCASLLEQLNDAQRSFDRWTRDLAAAQSALFMSWWKVRQFDKRRESGERPAINAELSDARLRVTTVTAELATAREQRDQAMTALTPEVPATLHIVEEARDTFERMGDPVVLFSGAGRSYKHGEDGRLEDDGRLFCRLSGQTVSGIIADSLNALVNLDKSNITVDVLPTARAGARLPREIADLCVEWFFLDTKTAPLLARRALELAHLPMDARVLELVKSTIEKQQTLIWNADAHATIDRQTIAELTGLIGQAPSKVGVAMYAPPWSPLYLDWRVTWYPSYPTTSRALGVWRFDGVDLQWDGPSPPTTRVGVPFIGRTLLTPQVTDVLQTRLRQFIAHVSPDDPHFGADAAILGEVAQAIDDWDILSQALSGFTDFLMMRQGAHHWTPDANADLPFGDMAHFIPLADLDPSLFFPVRAGHFTIDAIQIVDDFGQVLNPLAWRGQSDGSLQPIRSRRMITPGSDRRIQLAPRLNQPARIRFEFEPSPVSGWLLPNYLDRALSVYDARGLLLGELMVSSRPHASNAYRALWSPAPGSAASVGAPPQIADEHLLKFVAGLLSSADSGAALARLMATIDATLWGIDPAAARTTAGPPSLLVGRPLAVARADIAIELDATRAATNQAWARANAGDAGGVGELEVPVRLGNIVLPDDGLIGYFVNDRYEQCSAVYAGGGGGGGGESQADGDYVVQRDVSLAVGGPSKMLTMIFDPRAAVHAACGVLPMTSIHLPPALVDQAIANMAVAFRTGPLLSDPAAIRMPVPATGRGAWSWVQRTGVTVWETESHIAPASGAARLTASAPVMREGWLTLEGSQQ